MNEIDGTVMRISRDGRFAIVTLCNPAKRNALSLHVLEQLILAFSHVGASERRRPCIFCRTQLW
jgi:enoyl-CoA hydratase/carnithine racemase